MKSTVCFYKFNELWQYWMQNKSHIPHFAFDDWIKNEGGFTYNKTRSQQTVHLVDINIVNKKKFEWFSLKWL